MSSIDTYRSIRQAVQTCHDTKALLDSMIKEQQEKCDHPEIALTPCINKSYTTKCIICDKILEDEK
ncbi:hypothetical protein LCGC14_2257130 [marine sediment metagenome]|uniref:Uncharacterized protein n=1 Tax=marine sediment metagenome TaxID=412755 RepID=A0A0F9D0Q8_9ZZZZ